jgi:hypothetical protein
MGLPPLEWATWREWSASLMSPVQAAPGLLLYFVAPTTHTKRLRCALAVPSLREGQGMGTAVYRLATSGLTAPTNQPPPTPESPT